jgi:hypothetical protein
MPLSTANEEHCMSDKLRAGDAVEWNSHGGIAKGKVQKKLTSRTMIKGHQVAASPDNPELLVETDSGAQAAHKPQALRQRAPSRKPT